MFFPTLMRNLNSESHSDFNILCKVSICIFTDNWLLLTWIQDLIESLTSNQISCVFIMSGPYWMDWFDGKVLGRSTLEDFLIIFEQSKQIVFSLYRYIGHVIFIISVFGSGQKQIRNDKISDYDVCYVIPQGLQRFISIKTTKEHV